MSAANAAAYAVLVAPVVVALVLTLYVLVVELGEWWRS